MKKRSIHAIFLSLVLLASSNLCGLAAATASFSAQHRVSSKSSCHTPSSSNSESPVPCHKGNLCCHSLVALQPVNLNLNNEFLFSAINELPFRSDTFLYQPMVIITEHPSYLAEAPPHYHSPAEYLRLSVPDRAPPRIS
ncbi:hypothetical protein IH879_21020 [candidate division KSB1 bacterium]|nr:hypothetical protein [candidate division KSB1 bacterium]